MDANERGGGSVHPRKIKSHQGKRGFSEGQDVPTLYANCVADAIADDPMQMKLDCDCCNAYIVAGLLVPVFFVPLLAYAVSSL